MLLIHRWRRRLCAGVAALLLLSASAAHAQTDYYNTDAGRPLRVEDAYALERRAFEFQIAPLRLERAHGDEYHWSVEPEIALGILPRTQLEVAFPLEYVDAGPGLHTAGLAGVEISALYTLNAETALPAFGVGAGVLVPAGALGPSRPLISLKGLMTRTFTWARVHVNSEFTVEWGAARDLLSPESDAVRWMAGLAIDRAFPLRSMLLMAEVFAEEPLVEGRDLEWTAGAGLRYQLTPRWALDGGAGRRMTGQAPAWYFTFGSAVAVGLPWSSGTR